MKCSNPIALLVVLLLGMASANDTFALYRMPVTLPPDLQSPANYMSVTCAGGTEGIVQRLVVFDRNANYSTPDLSQWTDPPEDWPKVNQDIVNIRLLFAASIGNGYSCSCRIQHAGFTEWLGVLTEESSVGLDRLQTLPSRPEPSTFLDLNADYDPDTSYLQTVYDGTIQGSQSISFVPLTTILNGERVTSNDIMYRIVDGGFSVFVRVVRMVPDSYDPRNKNYTLSIWRAKANQDFDEVTDDVAMVLDHVIADASDISNALTFVLRPPPENEYYWIHIRNEGETSIFNPSPTNCATGEYFLQTQFPIMVSTEGCADVACDISGATFRASLFATLIAFLSVLLLDVL
jgi:hypothetical protein